MHKALLVGINKYPTSPLNGCINDISNCVHTIETKWKFPKNGIHMLADARATTSNILTELEWLVTDVKDGEMCLFHFSGHGVQVTTRNYQLEVDGMDESLCPVDFDWTNARMIRDKQLYTLFRKLPIGVKFCWINDSCHSGDLTKNMPKNPETPRTIHPPVDVAWDIAVAKQKKLACIGMNPHNRIVDVHAKSVTNGILDVGFVSGCRDDQTSADTVINGIPCGALTYHLMDNLRQMPKTTPLVKVVEKTSKDLAEKGFSQRPQAEGNRKNKPFLG